ncbi:hypothetical protein [Hydrogenivirga caldilitoris]|nr:hypothetical protein [Hydrogenivirga caldilitoris]
MKGFKFNLQNTVLPFYGILATFYILLIDSSLVKLSQNNILIHVILFVAIPLLILSNLFLFKIFYRPEFDLKYLIRSALAGSFPSVLTFFFVLFFAIFTSWIADFLKENNYYQAIGTSVFTFGLIFAFALSIPHGRLGKTGERQPKKVLICALSKPGLIGRNAQQKSEDEVFEEMKRLLANGDKERILGLDHTWAPFLELYLFHKEKLEKWYILISKEVYKSKDKFIEILGEEAKEIVHFKPESEGIDFNNYEEIVGVLTEILKEIKRSGYDDEDISVYISGGTSAITLALTLFAVKDGRQVEYLTQSENDKKIISINISFEDLYSFSPEARG